MRAIAIAILLSIATTGTSFAQLPAQKGVAGKGQRPTTAPSGKTIKAEPTSAPAMQLTNIKTKAVANYSIADAVFMIGINGYSDNEGVVVMSTVQKRDFDQSKKLRCPAAEIMVDFLGNGKLIKIRLEPGDRILAIGDLETKTLEELLVAVNAANDPHDLSITFVDWRSGNEYTGTINAMKVK